MVKKISPQQGLLVGLLFLEVAVFAVTGTNFLTAENFLHVTKIATELGLISLSMTAVILTGGIDLSVGSLLGLSAVLFGKLWRDYHLPWPVAAVVTLVVGAAGGGFNAALITRLRIHPLIVTLATLSLYRGLAEGITGGQGNFTNFPRGFLYLGQGEPLGMPTQLPIFFVAAILFWLLVHRSKIGRAWSVIGYTPAGARYAGLPVQRRLATAYILSGVMASLAALLYAARVGQAKADAGTGYELSAITAVVLGGTSIFGGRGSVAGTLVGLFLLSFLEVGLRLSDLPPELTAVCTSLLLLGAIGLDHVSRRPRRPAAAAVEGEFDMKTSQFAVLCGVILVAALIVVGGNFVILRGIVPRTATAKKLTIGMMPKSVGNAYFVACHKGATDAANELGATLLWDGPTGAEPGKQNEIVENWITRGVDVIAISVDNSDSVSTALRQARAKGIRVITWDADAAQDARDFFVNQATAEGIGDALMDNAAKVMGGSGKFAIITASVTAANQNEWMKYIEKQRAEKYPQIQMATVQACDDQQAKAFDEAKAIMSSDPSVKLILAISSAAVPGAAEAVKQSHRDDVHVVGLGLPNDNKPYVKAGITPALILWNTMDLGYLTIYASAAAGDGTLKPGTKSLSAGKLGTMQIEGSDVMLGKPFVFTKDNIDGFDL